MSTNLLGELAANQGTFIMNKDGAVYDYTVRGLKVDKILILSDTKITILQTTYEGDNVIDNYVSDSNIFMKAGGIITPRDGEQFEYIQMQTGCICLILG